MTPHSYFVKVSTPYPNQTKSRKFKEKISPSNTGGRICICWVFVEIILSFHV